MPNFPAKVNELSINCHKGNQDHDLNLHLDSSWLLYRYNGQALVLIWFDRTVKLTLTDSSNK